jgi:hypothetical protein
MVLLPYVFQAIEIKTYLKRRICGQYSNIKETTEGGTRNSDFFVYSSVVI